MRSKNLKRYQSRRDVLGIILTMTVWSLLVFLKTAPYAWIHGGIQALLSVELTYLAYCLYLACQRNRLQFWLTLALLLLGISLGYLLHFWVGIITGFSTMFVIVSWRTLNRQSVQVGTQEITPSALQSELDQLL